MFYTNIQAVTPFLIYEEGSNEKLRNAIKILNIARLSF